MKSRYEIQMDEVTIGNKDKIAVISGQQGDVSIHGHNFFELAYVTGGSALHTLNEKQEIVREGDYCIVDYGSRHSYSQSQNFTIINCLFLPEMIDDTLAECHSIEQLIQICLIRYSKQYYGQTTANWIFHDGDGYVYELLLGMQEEYRAKRTGYVEIFRCRMIEILVRSMRQIVQEEMIRYISGAKSMVVLAMIRYINIHYHEKSVLSRFCEENHYSFPYTSRCFKQETGITAHEYLKKVRIEKSCKLLAGSSLQVQEIAQKVGYEDVKYFNKLFRSELHLSPREYRCI